MVTPTHMLANTQHRRRSRWSCCSVRRGRASLLLMVSLLSGLLALPTSLVAGNVSRPLLPVPAEEEPTQSPAEEEVEEAFTAVLSREELLGVAFLRTQSLVQIQLMLRPQGVTPRTSARRASETGRNGCGGPLRC